MEAQEILEAEEVTDFGCVVHSACIGKLALALAKAQGQIKGALKDSTNPFFKSKYADLQSVWEACRAPLSANGLSVIQLPGSATETVRVFTYLLHESGEYIGSELLMTPVKTDPQGIGSCISYARRYALASLVGIYQADDDANSASEKAGADGHNQAQRELVSQKVEALKSKVENPSGDIQSLLTEFEKVGVTPGQVATRLRKNPSDATPEEIAILKSTLTDIKAGKAHWSGKANSKPPATAEADRPINANELKVFWGAVKGGWGWTEEETHAQLMGKFGIRSVKEITKSRLDEIMKYFQDNRIRPSQQFTDEDFPY
jgi:hypothetical protein